MPYGRLVEKGLNMATGQCNVKSYDRYLRDLIVAGRPGMIISPKIGIEEAPSA